jgi:O-antigen/teichoic acid export membrane protein
LPLLIVSVFLARTTGLTAVGYFSAATGLTAVAYQAALLGLRHLIVVDQLETHRFGHYVVVRSALVMASLPLTLAVGLLLNIATLYIIVAMALRIGDAFVDLNLAFDQVAEPTSKALKSYAALAWIKFGLVSFFILAFIPFSKLFPHALSAEVFVIFASMIFAVVAIHQTLRRVNRSTDLRPADGDVPAYLRMVRETGWYFVASVVCAMLTAMPRFMLPSVAGPKFFGVGGASLSGMTFFGMIYYASWLRNASKFSRNGFSRAVIVKFVAENLIILSLLVIGSLTAFAPVLGMIFRFTDADLVRYAGFVMAAGAVFFAAMNCANLFKPTAFPWLETVAYGAPVLAAMVLHLLGVHLTLPALMLLLSAAMVLCIGASIAAIGTQFAHRPYSQVN